LFPSLLPQSFVFCYWVGAAFGEQQHLRCTLLLKALLIMDHDVVCLHATCSKQLTLQWLCWLVNMALALSGSPTAAAWNRSFLQLLL
jgi:hypothetical protein